MGNVQGGRKKDTSYRKTFVLRQQTPMIHFQYADRGAVIRASEFKPKLDKFLVKKKGGENHMPGSWLLEQTDENKSAALNYKVRIWTAGKPEVSQMTEYTKELNNWEKLHHGTKNNLKDKKADLRKKYPKAQINGMYFGNMGNDTTTYKETIFYTEDIYVEIQCFVTGLLAYISDNMAEFMLVTNFGTRQSKGFGSFALMDDTIDPCNILSDNHYEYIYGIVKDDKKGVNHGDKMLNVAADVYAVMKGGINRRYDGRYIKGYIQRRYMDKCGKEKTGSDKAFMKSKIITVRDSETKEKKNDNCESYSEFEYVRALLGITDRIVFRDNLRKGTVRIKNKDIERFGSAIQITVWGNYIFLIMKDEEYIKNILDKEFTFSYMDNSKKIIKGRIKTPALSDENNFLEELVKPFLEGFVEYYNEERGKLSNLKFEDAANVELKMGGSGL